MFFSVFGQLRLSAYLSPLSTAQTPVHPDIPGPFPLITIFALAESDVIAPLINPYQLFLKLHLTNLASRSEISMSVFYLFIFFYFFI